MISVMLGVRRLLLLSLTHVNVFFTPLGGIGDE